MASLLAVDPGLDALAIAVFDADVLRLNFDEHGDRAKAVIQALVEVELVQTSPRDELLARLGQIAEGVNATIQGFGASHVYVELPAKFGQYARMGFGQRSGTGRNAEGMAKLHMAIGAAAGAIVLAGAELVAVPADRRPKDQRHMLLEVMLGHAGKLMPRNQDKRDAIWVGVTGITASPPTPREVAV